MWCHLRVPLSLSCHPFSSQGSGEQSQEIGGDSPSLPPVAWGVAVFISGCVRAGTEAWPRISVYKVLRVVPRTDTKGKSFFCPAHLSLGTGLAPGRLCIKKPVGVARAAGDSRLGAMPVAGKAAAETGLSSRPPPAPLLRPCCSSPSQGPWPGEGRRRGCGAPRAAGMSWRDQVLLLWELEEALPGQCRWEGWGLVRNGVSGSI